MFYRKGLLAVFACLVFSASTSLAADFSSYNDEDELYAIVKALPAYKRAENAAGYARLMELNPNNEMYKAKFSRYSAAPPSSVNSIGDLRQFLVGSWCVIKEYKESYLPNQVWKITVSDNGNYVFYRKPASSSKWDDDPKKGQLEFFDGRYSNSGTKYFGAEGQSLLMLTTNAGGRTIAWRNGREYVGDMSKNSCAKYE